MKRKLYYLTALVLCLTAASLHAQDRGTAVVEALAKKMTGYKNYRIEFTADMENEFSDLPGKIIVGGACYRVEINDYEVYCDGKNLYTYNTNEDEVTIEQADPADPSPLTNPARFFQSGMKDFRCVYKGTGVIDGKTVERIELIPTKQQAGGCQSILLALDQNALPVSIEYRTEGAAPISIAIKKVVPLTELPSDTFVFNRKAHPEVEVIDFR
ncbi:MAG TPA: outer membrane lipoprotein carrier protein LolA [Candidatus Alistipes merdigallinarum]|nr:outer membrane lipoprotein carrier protein LolA [Candidatus Alistipes merdigallinarum]